MSFQDGRSVRCAICNNLLPKHNSFGPVDESVDGNIFLIITRYVTTYETDNPNSGRLLAMSNGFLCRGDADSVRQLFTDPEIGQKAVITLAELKGVCEAVRRRRLAAEAAARRENRLGERSEEDLELVA